MDAVSQSFILDPNVLYVVLIAGAWIGMLALFVPGTGIIELVAGGGLLLGLGGLAYNGAGVPGLFLVVVSFVLYAFVILRQYAAASGKRMLEMPVPPLGAALAATVVQAAGGLLIIVKLPDLSWVVVGLLALGSLTIYRWMLVPTVSALRPPPQAGVEALLGTVAEVRTVPQPGKTGMVYLNGELWQATSDDELAVGDEVEVVSRDGMHLHVQKRIGPGVG